MMPPLLKLMSHLWSTQANNLKWLLYDGTTDKSSWPANNGSPARSFEGQIDWLSWGKLPVCSQLSLG